MLSETLTLIERLSKKELKKATLLEWGSPVLSFGDLSISKLATLGINPSNREFVDINGNELVGVDRRFHTLHSLKLEKWSDISNKEIEKIINSYKEYFFKNPYDLWFKKLNNIFSGAGFSYYNKSSHACHLDLVPYATEIKWTELSNNQKQILFNSVGDTLGLVLKSSPVEFLILNGKTVVESLQELGEVKFKKEEKPEWNLPRKSGKDVKGFAYTGSVSMIGGVKLKKVIFILGYNHNIQSSFGVTKLVQNSIRDWVSKNLENYNGRQA